MTETTDGARRAVPGARRAGAAIIAAASIALLSGCVMKTAPETENPAAQGQEAGPAEQDRQQAGATSGSGSESGQGEIIGDCSGARVEDLGDLGRPLSVVQGSSADLESGASVGLLGVRCEGDVLVATIVLGTPVEMQTLDVILGEPVAVPGLPAKIVLVEMAPGNDAGSGARISLVEIAG